MKKLAIAGIMATAALAAVAQQDARDAYQQRQAVAEVQRLASQFDQIENKMEQLAGRMNRIESANSSGDTRAEVAALKSEVAALRRRQDEMKREIVAEISRKMADLMAKNRPAPQIAPNKGRTPKVAEEVTGPTGPYYEHTVEPGETLSYIAKECNTTVQKIKLYNNMKNNILRVGQVVKIPAEDAKKK